MRAVLHAKFGDHLAKLPCASDRVPRTSPSPQLHDSSIEEFQAALTKARAAWRASRGPTRTATCASIARGQHDLTGVHRVADQRELPRSTPACPTILRKRTMVLAMNKYC
jgi:hypothetical protein